ncbi:drug resistance protein [Plectosphaerella cucumerina]|uniref:Drug resistance protein n=1 Tax=Plectosphaerella cucumerina TaxID=40658 RepID=A0A8K0WY05_9PEZI|nr:drug resistance protein [Plectosphaerella cucumerina]
MADEKHRPAEAEVTGQDAIQQQPQQHQEVTEKSTPVQTSTATPEASPSPPINPDHPVLTLSVPHQIGLVATLTGASFMNTLSLQAVVIILPAIGATLSIPEQRLQWIVSAYSLAFGCFLLLWGRIADLHGKKRIFIAGSAWVAAVIVANAFAPNEVAFNVFRGLHGLGAAANVPTAIGILGTTFPPGKSKNYAFSAYAAGAPLGSVFGNLLAGLIAEYLHWRWVFGVQAIMAAIVPVAGFFVIPPTPPALPPPSSGDDAADDAALRAKRSIDWIGGFLVTVGTFALLYALTEGNVVGWRRPYIPVVIVVSFLVIVAFIFWQRRLEKQGVRPPLMKVSLFKNKRYSAAMLIMALFFAAFNNFLIFATYYFQDYQGLSALQTTLRFIPTGVAGLVTAFVVALLLSRIPTYLLLVFGNTSMCVAALLFATPIPPTTSYFAYGLPAMVLGVIGADTTWPSLTLFISKSLPQEDQAVGGALINAIGQIGRAVGLAVSTAVQTSVMAQARGVPVEDVGDIGEWDDPSLKGLRAAQWTNFGFIFVSLMTVLFVFRSSEVVGRAEPAAPRSGGEEGIMNEELTENARR